MTGTHTSNILSALILAADKEQIENKELPPEVAEIHELIPDALTVLHKMQVKKDRAIISKIITFAQEIVRQRRAL